MSLDGFYSAVPCAIYVWPNARSYTRQPIVEIHTLGSQPVLQAALRTVCRCGARLAQPGEFTLRAFLAGRLDLTQAEAVLGVIDARSGQERDVALSQLAGGLAGPLGQLRDALVDLLAHVEAGLDFVDEDIEFISRDQLRRQIAAAHAQVHDLAERTTRRATLRDTVRAVLVGQPNAGKSSLFNALLNRPAALVSPVAGTTRDFLTGQLELDGACIELIDTAGLGVLDVRASAIRRNRRALEQAAEQATGRAAIRGYRDFVYRRHATACTARSCRARRSQFAAGFRRADKNRPARGGAASAGGHPHQQPTGAGLDLLRARLRHAALDHGGRSLDVVAVTAARCHESLRRAADALADTIQLVDQHAGEELVAAQLRGALTNWARLSARCIQTICSTVFSVASVSANSRHGPVIA